MNITPPCPPPNAPRQSPRFAVVYVMWGSTYLAIRICVAVLPPFLMAGARFMLAGGILLGWLLYRGVRLPDARQWKQAAITGSFLLLGGNGIVCWAEQTVNSSLAALILASAPIWFAVFDTIRPGRAGVRNGTPSSASSWVQPACCCSCLAPIAPTTASIVPRSPGRGRSWRRAVCGPAVRSTRSTIPRPPRPGCPRRRRCCAAAQPMASWRCCAENYPTFTQHWSPPRRCWPLAISYFSGPLRLQRLLWLLGALAPPAKVATYAYVNPLIATFLGWLILASPSRRAICLAALIILGGVLIVQWPTRAPVAAENTT